MFQRGDTNRDGYLDINKLITTLLLYNLKATETNEYKLLFYSLDKLNLNEITPNSLN